MLQEAVDTHQKAMAVSPVAEQIHYHLEVTDCKLGRWRDAVHAFKESSRFR
jgi:hypothetical protein